MPTKLFRILAGLAGIVGQGALGVYYSGVLVPRLLITGNVTADQLGTLARQSHEAILFDAWLQGIGALGSIVFFVALVYLSNAGTKFAGWMTLIASGVVLTIALGDVTFTVAAVQAAAVGHTASAQVAFDFIAGPTEAFDYTFLFVPAPMLILSAGAVLLGSRVLPRIFGYLALLIGCAFVVVGVASLFSSLAGATGTFFEVVQVGQALWVLGAAATLLARTGKS